jgi:hypothetical protein
LHFKLDLVGLVCVLIIQLAALLLDTLFQKRLTSAAKKAVSKMPQKTLRRGDKVGRLF